MFGTIKRFLIGNPLKTEQLNHEKFNVLWGLPILSSDAISSVAYASEEILLVLIPIIGMAAFSNLLYIALSIVALLFILVFSYRQTIDSYPKGGGSYIVSKDNLGTTPSLIAASSLTIDYILTVAVSTSAGTAAITSAFPGLLQYKIEIALLLISLLALGNLRGMKESSKIFGMPTYLFIFTIISMIVYGIIKSAIFGISPTTIHTSPDSGLIPSSTSSSLTIILFLKAFSAGCTALTGVEAVSDGIPNFKEPAQKNAKIVLGILAMIVLVVFGGVSYLASIYKAVPSHDVTVLAQIGMQVFGSGSFMFLFLQFTTALILTLAANTAFADLPMLLSIIARDGYAPRQFSKRGDRLSYSNGILLLALAAAVLVIIFNATTHYLLPLYAVGVFVSFTLSQSGMFARWLRLKTPGWKFKATVNGTGAIITFFTAIIIIINRFSHGAWIICILIPIFSFAMMKVKKHYDCVASDLRYDVKEPFRKHESPANHIIVPIDSFNRSFIKAYNYASIIGDDVLLFHISVDDENSEKLINKLAEKNIQNPIEIKRAPYRNVTKLLFEYIGEKEKQMKEGDMITIVMPQFVVRKWWHQLLHNQTSLFIKARLLTKRNVAVVTIPFLLKEYQ
ncbi:MAG: APC family permease [Clostridiaceae bacterium]